jgi:hypothetical protein
LAAFCSRIHDAAAGSLSQSVLLGSSGPGTGWGLLIAENRLFGFGWVAGSQRLGGCVEPRTQGGTISDATGNAIETGVRPRPVQTWGPGTQIPDYWLEPPTGLNIQGNPITVTGPRRASEMLQSNSGVCHWAACREVAP